MNFYFNLILLSIIAIFISYCILLFIKKKLQITEFKITVQRDNKNSDYTLKVKNHPERSLDKSGDLYKKFKPYASNIKVILQMSIGISITMLIIFKILIGLFPSLYELFIPIKTTNSPHIIENLFKNSILIMVSKGLATSTAVELAYMLFTPGPDEAIEPLLLGVSSCILYKLGCNPSDFEDIFIIILLILVIPVIYKVSRIFANDQKKKDDINK